MEVVGDTGKLILCGIGAKTVATHYCGIGEQVDGVVDGGAAYMVAVGLDRTVELVDVEMVRHLAHFVKYGKAFRCTSQFFG